MEKKKLAAIIVAICIFAAVGGTIAYQAVSAPKVLEPKPPMVASDPFNVIFRWGCGGAKNELNTYNGSVTKDLIVNGTVTTTLVLSEAELDGLQQKIIEMNLFSYPDVMPQQPNLWISTLYECSIQVQNGNETKEVSWDECSQHSSMLDSLKELEQYIIGLVEQTPEYQALPEAVGAYL